MSFVLGVLVIGALLSMIFGKRIGAMFVTGVGAVALAVVSIAIILVAGVLFFSNQNSPKISSSYGSESGSSYGSTPAAQTPSQTSTYQASSPYSPPPLSPSPAASTATGPRIGIDLDAVPASSMQQLTYLNVPAGAGCWVTSVHSDSPAENAGLRLYDVILSAGAQKQPADWITQSNQLPDYLTRVGYNVPVRLHVYRATEQRDFWVWVYPR